jgi:hypothetical protein
MLDAEASDDELSDADDELSDADDELSDADDEAAEPDWSEAELDDDPPEQAVIATAARTAISEVVSKRMYFSSGQKR